MSSLLKGKNVVIVVMARSYTSLHKRLTAQGGRNRKAVNSKTDYVVSNGYACTELSSAKKLGTTIITEAEFEGLLAGKPLSKEGAPGESPAELGEAFGRVRSIMASSDVASSQWFQLTEELDRCEQEGREALVSYIESLMDRAAQAQPFEGYFGEEGSQMSETRAMGSLPRVWFDVMSRHERDAKYRLVREVDMFYSGMSATFLTSLVKHPDATRIERIRLVQRTKPSKTLLKTICQHPNTLHLAHLGLGRMNQKVSQWLCEYASEARSLRTLDLSAISFAYGESVMSRLDFLKAPLFSTLETLVLPPMYDGQHVLDMLTDEAYFPSLRTLYFRQRQYKLIEHLANKVLPHEGVQRRITHLNIGPEWFWPPDPGVQLNALSQVAYTGHLDRLVLSDQGCVNDEKQQAHVSALLCEHLPGAPLLDRTKVLELGVCLTPELRKKLIEAHPDLVLV